MKKRLLILSILFFSGCFLSLNAQHFAVKNNLLYDATLTPNLGIEFSLSKKHTFDISGGYHPFTFSDGKSWKHWLVQPEYRYWFCEKFNGTFIGIHAHGGEFSFSKLDLPFGFLSQLKDHRYEGYFVGGGLSLGHHWMLSKRWGLEAVIGLGYAYINYDKYKCQDCGPKLKNDDYHYFGPTKAAISFVYIFN